YEGTTVLITGLIAAGDNPFTREFQPAAMYVYPPLYNLLVAPLTLWFDNTLQLHRQVSAVLIIASCLVCAGTVYHCGRSWRQSLAAAATLYAALLFYSTPVASSNALGVCLYLLILAIPWRYDFAAPSLALACGLGVLAFYAKQYFILSMAMLCLYLFLYVSVRRALLLGCAYALLLLASLALVHQSSPYYLDNTLFSPAVAMTRLQMPTVARTQFAAFFRLYWPLLLILGYWGVLRARETGWRQLLSGIADAYRPWRAGSGGKAYPANHFFWFCLVWASLVVFFSLGRNPGNYLSYLFQLMSPLLLIVCFGLLSVQDSKLRILAPLVLVCFYQVYALLPDDFSTTEENWARVEQLISEHEEILASQMLVATLLKYQREVEQDGHTFYFPLAENKPDYFAKPRSEARVAAVWKAYITAIYKKIEAGRYDLIMVTPWDGNGIFNNNPPAFSDMDGMTFLKNYYYLDETLALSMTERHGGGTYALRIWRPKPGP
ncbi:MAG: hypothetical protein O7F73_13240, partial [Gammaproteobacteria bacterium]|nr:hypothetical protein [Gammaproteobacteria bacterium]